MLTLLLIYLPALPAVLARVLAAVINLKSYMENTKIQKLIISVLFLIIVVSSYFYLLPYLNNSYTKNTQGSTNPRIDPVSKPLDLFKETSEKISSFQEADVLNKQGNYENAIVKYNEALKAANTIDEKSIIEISRASAYMSLKKYDLATSELKRIGDNLDYPISVRVASFEKILSEYRGTNDIRLLEKFKASTDSKENEYDLQLSAYRQIYNLYPAHPSGFAVSFLAIDTIKNATTTTDISWVYAQAMDKIEADIASKVKMTGSSYKIPNLILSKIRVMEVAEKKGISKSELIYQEYERAISESRSRLQNVTEYFTMFGYLNYLGIKGEKDTIANDKASAIFNVVSTSKIPDMVAENLKSKNYKSDWPGLYLYAKRNTNAMNYFSAYGWK